jgi:hypothetical protein
VKPSLLAALVLVAILIAIYGPGIGKGFVKDDVVWVGANHVTSWSDMRALLVRTDGFYRPVVAATFAVDRAIYGLEPFGFGVTNLLLLMLGAAALGCLGAALGLRAGAAIVAAGLWALNFHAVNMAVLWLSGRTALCVAIAALLSAAAVVKRRPVAAGVAALIAMFAKEEAVMLPVILSGWAWVLSRQGTRGKESVHEIVDRTWPIWVAAALYLAARAQTSAMTPMTATAPYQFVLAPGALAGNALEYLDRSCTFSASVLVIAHVVAWRRPVTTASLRRVFVLGAIWFMGTFALTIFVPNRSSLYALLPSAAPALITAFLLQQLWDSTNPVAHRRLVAATMVLPVLLLPVYWSRNVRWTEIAELSSDTFSAIRRVVRERPDVDRLLFRDDRSTRRSFANTYDGLLPEAVRLAAGRDIKAETVASENERTNAVVIALREGGVVVESPRP